MSAEENRKRIQELRRIGFQKFLTGVVIIFAVGVICFIFLDENADSQSHSGGSYSRGRGLGMVLLAGLFGLWNIVLGVIYLIRAQSGDEHYAKAVEDVIDSRLERTIGKRMARKDYSTRNVLVLLGWVFLFLAVVGGIAIGYLFWTRPR
jgi:drug/metabolite transporter (DMT)-like permease